MKNVLLVIFFAVFLSFASHAQDKFITAGSGGGFSGIVNVYKILPDGKIFKGNGTAEVKYTECSKIKRKKASELISRTSEGIKTSGDANHPGNMYYFISLSENGKDSKITWGDPGQPAPESVRKLYQEILDTVGSLKYKPVK